MTRAAIMQPTYLPWIGYFGLIYQVDIFVIYDDVQFDKRSWQQRNKIKTQSGSQWLTVPVKSKGMYSQKINEVIIDPKSNFSTSHIKAIETNYARAPFFKVYKNYIFDCIESNSKSLLSLNQSLICLISNILNIEIEFVRSSDLKVAGKKEERLVNICKKLSADRYVSPPGSKVYLDETDIFVKNNLTLAYQNFKHPIYPQINGDFISHMAIIDVLFNCGSDKTCKLISSSIKPDFI